MRNRLQFGITLLAMAGSLGLAADVYAQKPAHNNPPPPPPHPAQAHPQNQNPNRPPNASAGHPDVNPNANRPAQNYTPPQPSRQNFSAPNQPHNGTGAGLNQRQQLGVGAARPWVDTMRELSPAQRERVLQNSKAFQNLSPDKQAKIRQQLNQWDRMTPQQRQDLRTKEDIWTHLTPGQQQHLKNEVWPKWQQMPWQRQQMMKQKLGILQNMPESARNQRLNDPNFTRGMSDDEKSMLHDLSHTHVGSPPENPPQ